jgi:hypothetical protein
MAGWDAGEGLVGALLRDPGCFPSEAPEIIELCPAYPTSTDDLDALHGRGMEREDPLDADTGRDLPNHESLRDAATPPADADPLEGLDPLFLPLTDTVKNPDRIPWRELGDVLAKLLLLELSQQIRHDSPQKARIDRNKIDRLKR